MQYLNMSKWELGSLLVMWYFAIYLGRAALKEPESNGSQIRTLINKTLNCQRTITHETCQKTNQKNTMRSFFES